MPKIIQRTRLNPAGRGSKKRLGSKSPVKEPARPMGWEPNTPIKRKSNKTAGKRQNERKTSTKQVPNNVRKCHQEMMGIQQKCHSNVGKNVNKNNQPPGSDSDSDSKCDSDSNSDSNSESETELLTASPNFVNQEVSNKYKTSIDSNLTDNTVNDEEFHSVKLGRLRKMLKGLTQEVEKIMGTTKVYGQHSSHNVTKDGENRVTTETTPPSVGKTLKNTKTSITNDLRAYVRDKFYLDMKFAGSEIEQEALLLDAIKSGGLRVPDGVTKRQFRNFFVPQVPSSFSRLRGNSQTLCQKHWRGKKNSFECCEITNINTNTNCHICCCVDHS